jgi:hypothetical protein
MLDQVAADIDLRTVRILLETRNDVVEDALLADDVIDQRLHRIERVGDVPLQRKPRGRASRHPGSRRQAGDGARALEEAMDEARAHDVTGTPARSSIVTSRFDIGVRSG